MTWGWGDSTSGTQLIHQRIAQHSPQPQLTQLTASAACPALTLPARPDSR